MTTLKATTGTTTFDVALDKGKVAELNSRLSEPLYSTTLAGPDLTTDGIQLLNADDSLVTISEGMTKIPTLGHETLTATLPCRLTRLASLRRGAAEANVQLQAARTGAADAVDDAETARDDDDTSTTDAQTALTAIKTAATTDINLDSLTGEDSVSMAITDINVTLAADPTEKKDLKTPKAVFAEVKEIIDNAIAARTATTTFALEGLHLRGRHKRRNLTGHCWRRPIQASGVFEGTIRVQDAEPVQHR